MAGLGGERLGGTSGGWAWVRGAWPKEEGGLWNQKKWGMGAELKVKGRVLEGGGWGGTQKGAESGREGAGLANENDMRGRGIRAWAGPGESSPDSGQPRRAPGHPGCRGCRPGRGRNCGRRRAPQPGS